ncbi:uncharacterized protein SETTUDRAFT_30070 [Exserohilum turcica Et28A]|uniref:Uncharacterized protein n=1 Tax=Exserohilum turcicum (strain 28A) TaxID=671987 RepID=R0J3L0_EXST2|nr:uncharacterized protein SETTUDRAFT_30070 [Exserohilum turcica Et28A]EOA91540.1 hypothetical protein SETTUDRAFT_30070 [Exserohilum turcica Et28A]
MKATLQSLVAFASILSIALGNCNQPACSVGVVETYDTSFCVGRVHRDKKWGQPGVFQGDSNHWDWEVQTDTYKINIWDNGLVTFGYGQGHKACVMQITTANGPVDVMLPPNNAGVDPNWNGVGCCLPPSLTYGIQSVWVWN